MMSIDDIDRIMKALESMIQYELMLSDFYKQCADILKEDRSFWQNLSNEEIHHADNIKKIREIITKKHDSFEAGRPFNPIALDTAMTGLKDIIRRLTSSTISCEKILIVARDIEQSILESNYAEIVKTADLEYQSLMKGIISQTYEHKKIVREKIEALKAKA